MVRGRFASHSGIRGLFRESSGAFVALLAFRPESGKFFLFFLFSLR